MTFVRVLPVLIYEIEGKNDARTKTSGIEVRSSGDDAELIFMLLIKAL